MQSSTYEVSRVKPLIRQDTVRSCPLLPPSLWWKSRSCQRSRVQNCQIMSIKNSRGLEHWSSSSHASQPLFECAFCKDRWFRNNVLSTSLSDSGDFYRTMLNHWNRITMVKPECSRKQEHAMNIHEHFECNNFLYDSIFGDVPFQIGGAQKSQQNRLVFKLANLGQRTRTTYVPTVGFVAFWRADVSCDRQHTNGQQALPALLALPWGRSSSGEGGCGLALDQARTEIQRTVKNFEANRSDRWWMDPISTRNNSTWNHLV